MNLYLKYVILVLSLINFSCFLWSVLGVFVKKGEATSGLNVIKFATVPTMLVIIYTLSISININYINGFLAFIMLISSFLLFWSCVYVNKQRKLSLAYSNDLPEHLVNRGAYKFVRHPFYLSYLTSYLAGLVASKNLLLTVPILLMTYIYYHAARKEENKFAMSSLAEEYENYKKETGMFLPKLIR